MARTKAPKTEDVAWPLAWNAPRGLPSIETGVFGGIVVGLIAAVAFNRYYRLQLPGYLGFRRRTLGAHHHRFRRDRARRCTQCIPRYEPRAFAAMVKVDGQTLHLLVGLNVDQYAAEIRGQLATPLSGAAAVASERAAV